MTNTHNHIKATHPGADTTFQREQKQKQTLEQLVAEFFMGEYPKAEDMAAMLWEMYERHLESEITDCSDPMERSNKFAYLRDICDFLIALEAKVPPTPPILMSTTKGEA